jgi:hypothetical protein
MVVSLSTLYLSVFRKGTLRIEFGEVLQIQMFEDGRISVTLELAIFNPGSKTAVTKQLTFELIRLLDDRREPMIWTQNVTTVFVEENRGRDTRFESYPSTLFVPGGEAVSKRVALETLHSLDIRPGDYEVNVTIRSLGTSRYKRTARTKLRLATEDTAFIVTNKVGPPNTARRVLILLFQRGENTNCYLRAPGFKVEPLPNETNEKL